jgi:hypothetical protein
MSIKYPALFQLHSTHLMIYKQNYVR